jgi:hypothetical protein
MSATQKPDESETGQHMINEPDIGSGEKTPGEKETEEEIRKIPTPPAQTSNDAPKP